MSLCREWCQAFKRLQRHFALLMTLVATMILIPQAAAASDALKIGILTTLEGVFAPLGRDAIRGYELAIEEFGYSAGGRSIEAVIESTDGTIESVTERARQLTNGGAHILIGPLNGIEGLAIRDFAKSVPHVTIINGASAAPDATRRSPDNFFRFNPDSMQWMAGLGSYAYEKKRFRRMIAVGEDYSFAYNQLMGFMIEYCALGGQVVAKHWIPPGANHELDRIAPLIADPENDADALFLALDPDATKRFLTAYSEAGGRAPIVTGSTALLGTLRGMNGPLRRLLDGAISAVPISIAQENQAWVEFKRRYDARYPEVGSTPSLFALAYYINTKALMLALQATKGQLGEGHATLRAALTELRFETPLGGPVELDGNRHAVTNSYIVEVGRAADGSLRNRVVEVVPDVDHSLGLPPDEMLSLGPPGRDNPSCP